MNNFHIESIFLLFPFLFPNKQVEHLIVMFWLNKDEIGIYFLFHYLPLDNNKVNYFVIIVDMGSTESISFQMETGWNKFKLNMENLSPGSH